MERNEYLEKMCSMSRTQLFSFCKKELAQEKYSLDANSDYIFAHGSVPVLVIAVIADFHHEKPAFVYTDDVLYAKNNTAFRKECVELYATLAFAKKVHCSFLIVGGSSYAAEDIDTFIESQAANDRTINAHFLLSFSGKENDAVCFASAQQDFIDYVTGAGFTKSTSSSCSATNRFVNLSPTFDLPGVALPSGFVDGEIPHFNNRSLDESLAKACTLATKSTKSFSTLLHQPVILRNADQNVPVLYEVNEPLVSAPDVDSHTEYDGEMVRNTLGSYFKHLHKPFCLKFAEGITELHENECYNYENLVSVEIPSSVTKIGNFAFGSCAHLKEAVIPNSVKEMGEAVFAGCYELEKVHLSSHLAELPNRTFNCCEQLYEVQLPDSIRTIGAEAFNECSQLKNVMLPKKLTCIGPRAFSQTAIESIQLPHSLTAIQEGAFYECYSLSAITLPEQLTELGTNCFMECTGLHTVSIPDTITKLPSRCFALCHALSEVRLPSRLAVMGNGVFLENFSLTTITLPKTLRYIGRNAFNATSLSSIELPSKLCCIESGTFYHCKELISIRMHEGIESIGEFAFAECDKLKKMNAPKSVQFISGGNDAIRKQKAN